MSSKMYSYQSYYDKFRVGFELDWNDLKPEAQAELISRCMTEFHGTDIASKLVDVSITCFREEKS